MLKVKLMVAMLVTILLCISNPSSKRAISKSNYKPQHLQHKSVAVKVVKKKATHKKLVRYEYAVATYYNVHKRTMKSGLWPNEHYAATSCLRIFPMGSRVTPVRYLEPSTSHWKAVPLWAQRAMTRIIADTTANEESSLKRKHKVQSGRESLPSRHKRPAAKRVDLFSMHMTKAIAFVSGRRCIFAVYPAKPLPKPSPHKQKRHHAARRHHV
ncbi:MAG: hypothetical protein NTW50_01005 [Candidatus Berkelbacteria bacterium]|nr:hypothetical protein [Candidatus Berkelbacteria bacterium]